MAEYAGLLEKIYEDADKSAHGPYVKISFKVAGAPKSFGTIVKKANEAMLRSVAEGDMVRLTTVMNGKYENLGTIERIKQEAKDPMPAPESPKAVVVAAATHMADKAVAQAVTRIDDKDFRITYLACRRDAIELVNALVASGALPLGTKAADKADNFYKAVQRYALALAHDSWNVRPADAAKLEVEAPVEKAVKATKYEE
jgi:hypothetical protein